MAGLGNGVNGWTGEERGGADVRAGEDAMQETRVSTGEASGAGFEKINCLFLTFKIARTF